MATYGITDCFATVSITKNEYEKLVRDSETLNLLRNYLSSNKYISADDLRLFLNIQKEEQKESEE